METTHRIVVDDARSLDTLADDSVELVVTSPPYPMIEMWDELFSTLNPAVDDALTAGDGQRAFEAMHAALEPVWDELARVLVDGGVACLNVGDATRTIDGSFRVYQNHSRIIEAFAERGFEPLPEVLWRKPTNSAAKFMGSGMLPPNAYVTLEHEYILPFRNGPERRRFEPHSDRRYEAAYFWEERNRWFSDVWTDLRGIPQGLDDREDDDREDDETGRRERSAAYPLGLPARLIRMYSVYGDTVLDPFVGTGTTTLAAALAGRNSVGYELDSTVLGGLDERMGDLPALSGRRSRDRLAAHRRFAADRHADDESLGYDAEHYDVRVMTNQERSIRLYTVKTVESTDDGYRLTHEPLDGATDDPAGGAVGDPPGDAANDRAEDPADGLADDA